MKLNNTVEYHHKQQRDLKQISVFVFITETVFLEETERAVADLEAILDRDDVALDQRRIEHGMSP